MNFKNLHVTFIHFLFCVCLNGYSIESQSSTARTAEAYLNSGSEKETLGKYEEAIFDYNQAIENDPQFAEAYFKRGRAKLRLGRHQEALDDFDKVIEIYSDFDIFNHEFIITRLGNNADFDFDKAKQDLNKAIQTTPQYAEAYYYRGFTKTRLGRNEEAIVDYDKAIEIYSNFDISTRAITAIFREATQASSPRIADLYFYRGIAKARLGKNEEAIVDYDEALKINPQDDQAYLNRGNANARLGKNEEAIVDYDEALKINPQNAVAYYYRGRIKADLDRYEEAIADYDQALKINPQDDQAYLNRGNANAVLGKHEEAIADYDKAIRINPQDASTYSSRGSIKLILGRHQEAIADFDEAIKIDPQNDIRTYLMRGGAKEMLGMHQEAFADFNKAIEMDPQNTEVTTGKKLLVQDLLNLNPCPKKLM